MIQDNTAKWKARKLTDFKVADSALPVGHIYQTINPTVPLGSLPLFGGLYDRALYADLWSWVQEQPNFLVSEEEWQSIASANGGNVPKFSTGDGSTTFRMPSMKCWVKGANGIEEVGSYLQAGLPNITGYVGSPNYSDLSNYDQYIGEANTISDGAFNILRTNSVSVAGIGNSNTSYANAPYGMDIDASRCSPIYGNSDTVQPPSIVGMWLIVAFGTISNVGNADVGNVMQAVEQVQTASEKAIDSGTNYIRYESGLQICWGYHDGTKDTSVQSYTITFPVSFVDTNTALSLVRRSGKATTTATGEPWVRALTTTNFNLYYSTATGCNWIAIGKWK